MLINAALPDHRDREITRLRHAIAAFKKYDKQRSKWCENAVKVNGELQREARWLNEENAILANTDKELSLRHREMANLVAQLKIHRTWLKVDELRERYTKFDAGQMQELFEAMSVYVHNIQFTETVAKLRATVRGLSQQIKKMRKERDILLCQILQAKRGEIPHGCLEEIQASMGDGDGDNASNVSLDESPAPSQTANNYK